MPGIHCFLSIYFLFLCFSVLTSLFFFFVGSGYDLGPSLISGGGQEGVSGGVCLHGKGGVGSLKDVRAGRQAQDKVLAYAKTIFGQCLEEISIKVSWLLSCKSGRRWKRGRAA